MHNSELILCEWFYGRRRIRKICVGKRIERRTNSDACRIELTVSQFWVCLRACDVRACVRASILASTYDQLNRNELINKVLPEFVHCFVIFPRLFDSTKLTVSIFYIHLSSQEQHALCCECALHAAYVESTVATDK